MALPCAFDLAAASPGAVRAIAVLTACCFTPNCHPISHANAIAAGAVHPMRQEPAPVVVGAVHRRAPIALGGDLPPAEAPFISRVHPALPICVTRSARCRIRSWRSATREALESVVAVECTLRTTAQLTMAGHAAVRL